jgi:DUF438 domain-containing protein
MKAQKWNDILVGEHELIERAMDVMGRELEKLPENKHDEFIIRRATDFLLEFGDRIHNKKEEEFLFPLMVKRNIPEDGPIRVMLLEHETERKLLGEMHAVTDGLSKISKDARSDFMKRGLEYLEVRSNHIWKENDVLYKMGLQVFSERDSEELVAAFERINHQTYGENALQKFSQMLEEVEGGIKARTSLLHNLSYEQIDAIMETLPVEVTFVDADDTVAYFNRLDKDKIFVRTRSVVGRKVDQCHPEKSVDKVKRIVNGFKDGSLDKAEFWIDFMGDKVLIRYYPVKNEGGQYLGVLEVTQKIGGLQQLAGEKRLLD